jgi:hypothetical protein
MANYSPNRKNINMVSCKWKFFILRKNTKVRIVGDKKNKK